jgi:hypothetical protein
MNIPRDQLKIGYWIKVTTQDMTLSLRIGKLALYDDVVEVWSQEYSWEPPLPRPSIPSGYHLVFDHIGIHLKEYNGPI